MRAALWGYPETAITERLAQDPAFYEKFSKLIQQAIDDYRSKRITDLEYLKRATDIKNAVVNRKTDDVPMTISGNPPLHGAAISFEGDDRRTRISQIVPRTIHRDAARQG